jgi:hypothetical protein
MWGINREQELKILGRDSHKVRISLLIHGPGSSRMVGRHGMPPVPEGERNGTDGGDSMCPLFETD